MGKIELLGKPCVEHGSYTFYKAVKIQKGNECRVVSIGTFFTMKYCDDGPLTIGELKAAWIDANSCNQLVCIKVYLSPMDVPDIEDFSFFGEDEVVGYTERLIVSLEDMLDWTVINGSWNAGVRGFIDQEPTKKHFEVGGIEITMDFTEVVHEKKHTDHLVASEVMVVTYNAYCRHRAVLKRFDRQKTHSGQRRMIESLGGIFTENDSTRIVFCRDYCYHQELDILESRCDNLAPVFKGRPRKKKSTSPCSDKAHRDDAQKISTRNSLSKGSPLKSEPEIQFWQSLRAFMKQRGTPIGRTPSLGMKKVDLYALYQAVQDEGGYEAVCQKRIWKKIFTELGCMFSTSAATYTRRHYEKFLLPFEQYMKSRGSQKENSGTHNSNNNHQHHQQHHQHHQSRASVHASSSHGDAKNGKIETKKPTGTKSNQENSSSTVHKPAEKRALPLPERRVDAGTRRVHESLRLDQTHPGSNIFEALSELSKMRSSMDPRAALKRPMTRAPERDVKRARSSAPPNRHASPIDLSAKRVPVYAEPPQTEPLNLVIKDKLKEREKNVQKASHALAKKEAHAGHHMMTHPAFQPVGHRHMDSLQLPTQGAAFSLNQVMMPPNAIFPVYPGSLASPNFSYDLFQKQVMMNTLPMIQLANMNMYAPPPLLSKVPPLGRHVPNKP